jgi:hypothetical protein
MIRVVHPDFLPIPDPGVKKTSIPDPGSGSATLPLCTVAGRYVVYERYGKRINKKDPTAWRRIKLPPPCPFNKPTSLSFHVLFYAFFHMSDSRGIAYVTGS